MADEAKIGTHWQDDELDAIVADYFDMLEADLSGRPYVKLRHSEALMERIGRTHRCVFRSKWATDSGKKWATDSASKWATDSGGI